MKTKLAIVVLSVSTILISCAPAVRVIPTETIASPNVTPSNESTILNLALSADGTNLAIYTNTGVYIYDTETLSKTIFREFNNLDYGKNKDEAQSGAVAFSSDGKIIAISGKFSDTPVQLWDLRTSQYLMDIYDIPPAYLVTKIQFSPDGKSIFIRSNYDWSMRCEQADANFALHMLDFSNSPKATKIFSTDICQVIPMGFIRFTDNNKFLVFVQLMGPKYLVTTVDITATATAQEIEHESLNELYDISPNGKVYAFLGSQENSRITKLIEAGTSKVLRTIPYRVKLFDNENRFLVRDFFSLDSEWGLWENENIICNFEGLTNSKFDWELSANGQIFTTMSSDNDVIIWDVSDCSIKNVLQLGK